MIPSPARFRRALLAWHKLHGRHDLPWRGRHDPYGVLVSEFMLQQTTVATVLPYYRRFLRAFPTLGKLAEAPLERVLELWSGLGYYARARNLHSTAKIVVLKYDGRFPESREEIETLPGVGPYTAGALLSFIHDKPEALVDGNVERVLARIWGISGDVKSPRIRKRIWALARRLVPPSGGRLFNAALMDLGSLVCRPAAPDCPACPFRRSCRARALGRQEVLPASAADRPRKRIVLHAGLLRRGRSWVMTRRPAGGLYGGLWEFPSLEFPAETSVGRIEKALGARLRTRVALEKRFPPVFHTLSHREMKVIPWIGRADDRGTPVGLFPRLRIARSAVSSLTRKLAGLLPD
jgi:A/G-specific adenine glycosylase